MMDMHNTKTNLGGVGVLTMAFGDERYVRQAENLALSLAHNMPSLPVSVITDRRSVSELFDYAIRLDSSFGLGTVQKIYLDRYTPYSRTLFIDADSIVARPFDDHLARLLTHPFTPVAPLYRTRTDEDEFFDDLGARSGRRLPPSSPSLTADSTISTTARSPGRSSTARAPCATVPTT